MFRVGILGMGRIAAGFDSLGGSAIRTHLKAVLAESRLGVVAVADPDVAHASSELARFCVRADVLSIDALLAAKLDVLCIASPDGTHLDYIERAATGSIKTVFVEKPLEPDGERRRRALRSLEMCGAVLLVHHLRRWIPPLSGWIDDARAGGFGRPISAVVHYSRGFRHNAIHALDLVAAFIGTEVSDVRSIAPPIFDYSAEDPTLSLAVMINVGGSSVMLLLRGVDGRLQTAFEVDIRFDYGRIRIFDEAGIKAELYRMAPVDVPGFAPELIAVDSFYDSPPGLLGSVWGNIADHLEQRATLACEGSEALLAYDFSDAILARVYA